MMKKTVLRLFHIRIPMRYAFGHARATRSQADNVIAQIVLADGSEGWGEAVPREYVTGETIVSIFDCYQRSDLSFLPVNPRLNFEEATHHLWNLDLPKRLSSERLNHAAACAAETALLDCFARREKKHLAEAMHVIPELKKLIRPQILEQVRVSIAIPDDLEGALKRAGRIIAKVDAKVKVGFGIQQDRERFQRVKEEFGDFVELRGDANGAWNLEQAAETLSSLAHFHLSCIEEPIIPRQFQDYAKLRKRSSIPVMLDESLCSMSDAVMAHECGAADIFNLRISKCGGVLGTLRIAEYAATHGLGYQIGAMVGETGLLSSLGRSLAANLKAVRYLETAVPRTSLEADITDADLTLQEGTRLSPVPTGPGFGGHIDPEAVRCYTVKQIEREL